MATRDSIHALVDDLPDGALSRAKQALEKILGFDVTEDEREELLDRETECDRGEVVLGTDFLYGEPFRRSNDLSPWPRPE